MATTFVNAQTTTATRAHSMDDPARGARDHELREFLLHRRRQLQHALEARVQDIRDGHASRATDGVLDLIESSDIYGQEDLDYALAELEGEMVGRIDEALCRLDAGVYGVCADCGGPIAVSRLRALPFAVRCRSCEETRETRDRERARVRPRLGMTPRREEVGW